MTQGDRQLLLELLKKSELFDEKGKMVIRGGVEQETIPELDVEYLLDVFKMEQNLVFAIDQRADRMIEELKQKYQP